MKSKLKHLLACAATLLPLITDAQSVDYDKYPDFTPSVNPDFSLLKNSATSYQSKSTDLSPLPDHVNNAEFKFFPPVFNQDGGSCGSASRICYMFTYELNAFRNLDAQSLSNRYPSHFVWLLTYGNSGKDEMVQHVGVPSAEVYGGTTYSTLFGNQAEKSSDFGWMQGYEKWYSAMWNRMLRPAHIPAHVGTKEGREALKRWIYNHNGDTDFQAGGIAGIGVASGGTWLQIPASPVNDEIGVTNMYYVKKWGTSVDHALTVVGYDDRIEFDLNGNGIMGERFDEPEKDEKGAWIVVNSWGDWCNKGFIYCPYAYAGPLADKNGNFPKGNYWQPEIYKVRKNYRPLRTIKVKMDYSHRSEICLNAGISTDLNASMPERTIAFEHFKYAGDGKNGDSIPAPKVPMLGRWADGKLHTEPMEFGYDLTDFSAQFDKNQPLKYFFIVETKPTAEGSGHIYNASILDYEFDKEGIETPFPISSPNVKIENKGNKTIISTIVYGESYFAPRNLSLNNDKLNWQAPLPSVHSLSGYIISSEGVELCRTDNKTTSFELQTPSPSATYSVAAIYTDGTKSTPITTNTPVKYLKYNKACYFKHSGLTIPDVFDNKYDEVTLEYWINPSTVMNWNQSGGPGWGQFMFHANASGSFTVGWDTENRINTTPGSLSNGRWTHIAITVNKNVMKVYIDGKLSGTCTSHKYSGLGGFGPFEFRCNNNYDDIDARIDEIRIWKKERSAKEIQDNKNTQYSGEIMPKGLMAYYRMEQIVKSDGTYLRDCVGNHHAKVVNKNIFYESASQLTLVPPQGEPELSIEPLTDKIYTGYPIRLKAHYNQVINSLKWSVTGTKLSDAHLIQPEVVFTESGEQTITLVGGMADNKDTVVVYKVNVEPAPLPNADFQATSDTLPAGTCISLHPTQPIMGCIYSWSMPGAKVTTAQRINTTAHYEEEGHYEITLTVTDPDGRRSSVTKQIVVTEVAPLADFTVTPAVITKGESTFLRDLSKFQPTRWNWKLHSPNKDIIVNGRNSSLILTTPGLYDVTLTATNNSGKSSLTHKNALAVCNADSKNGLNFTNKEAYVRFSKVPYGRRTDEFTFDWWMKPEHLPNTSCGIGESGSFSITVEPNGSFTITSRDSKSTTNNGIVIPNEWHHYAITHNNGDISIYRDGQLVGNTKGPKAIAVAKTFQLGLPDAPMLGQIDEFRFWLSVLNIEDIRKYAVSPIADIDHAMTNHKLTVYYDFNQNSGDVIDRTLKGHDGKRIGFGPDGDAWGLSKGVFALNFEERPKAEDVTSIYLVNAKAPFERDEQQIVNPTGGQRFGALAKWTLENAILQNNITTGAHVDADKQSNLTVTTGWDGFANQITNHKVYQTVDLPAGFYEFIARYGNYEGNPDQSYILAAEGQELPETSQLSKAIAYSQLLAKQGPVYDNSVCFALSEPTKVSLGLLFNITGKRCFTINDFLLKRSDIEIIDANEVDGFDLTVNTSGKATLFLPYAVTIPQGVTAYRATAIEGNVLVLNPIEQGIIPAGTGVVVTAAPGIHHFEPTSTELILSSLLKGVTSTEEIDPSLHYFSLSEQPLPGFYPYTSTSLEPFNAYLILPAGDALDHYELRFVPVGISSIEEDPAKQIFYDTSGRYIEKPSHGVFVTKGKKLLIK